MKRRSIFKLLAGVVFAASVEVFGVTESIKFDPVKDDGKFTRMPVPRMPRFDFVDGRWISRDWPEGAPVEHSKSRLR
jgi:hypothetical protein